MSALDRAAELMLREMLEGIEAGRLVVVGFAGADSPDDYGCTVRCAQRSAVETAETTATTGPHAMTCPSCRSAKVTLFDEGWNCADCGEEWPRGDDESGQLPQA